MFSVKNEYKTLKNVLKKKIDEKQQILLGQARFLASIFPSYIEYISINKYNLEIKCDRCGFMIFSYLLKHSTNTQYNVLLDVVGIDTGADKKRFVIKYLLLSTQYNSRIILTIDSSQTMRSPSLYYVYHSSSWLEREVWDLFGIEFAPHSDLRRILTDYGFQGHPLRKDYPLTGFQELYYDENKKRILYVPVSLSQGYRNFSFKNPWRHIT
jgi:NADH dehydrogenase (ubiquinone) Fe-S protein 3